MIDLTNCKLICESVIHNNNMKIFEKEQIYRNEKGRLYVHYEGGERSSYGIKKGPMTYKPCQGTRRISKKIYKLWRESKIEFVDENSWFIDLENEEMYEKLWDEAKKFCTYSRIRHSIKDVPF